MKSILLIGDDDHERQARITRMIMEKFARKMEDKIIEACGLTPEMMHDSSSTASIHATPASADKIMADILEAKACIERMMQSPTPAPVLDPWNIRNKFREGIGYPSFFTLPKIYSNPNLTEQFRFPVSKRKRIRKKWSKRPENWRPSRSVYVVGEHGEGGMFCHPIVKTGIERVIK